jgi:hypothetical protein
MGLALFQVFEHQSWGVLALSSAAVVAAGMLHSTGSHSIDWWALVAGSWWLSVPVAGAAELLLVVAQERSSGWYEVDYVIVRKCIHSFHPNQQIDYLDEHPPSTATTVAIA